MSDSFITHYDVSGSALAAERTRMRTIANNIANINTTRTSQGGPYKRQFAILKAEQTSSSNLEYGVSVDEIMTDSSAPRLVYDPDHPDADSNGYIALPNVDVIQEVTDMKTATMAYQANLTVINATKQIIARSLEIGR
ncbi:MAG: flagellar basal body rod protein FlgC [Candidatus Omnitrophica bacterium]|nr:flagellar basal body rod protein FlgC [Candidatus Omnitrophota bacterium]